MVTLTQVQSSNALIGNTLPPGLVAVFVGATNGIGETTLKQFAKHASSPRVYFIGRSQEAGDRIAAECKALNDEGEFVFIQKDLSLIRNVDEVCKQILSKEKSINILFLTIGTLQAGIKTEEGLHLAAALAVYSRNRFIQNLLPSIKAANGLRRVVTTFVATMEGRIDMTDFQGWNMKLMANRDHAASITTLALEHHAQLAPEVSFIHNFPGHVKSGIARDMTGVLGTMMRIFSSIIGPLVRMPLVEAGDRHVFLATSSRYANGGVPLTDGIMMARGTDGKEGSGVYSVDMYGESAGPRVEEVLARHREAGLVETVWRKIDEEYTRIVGAVNTT